MHLQSVRRIVGKDARSVQILQHETRACCEWGQIQCQRTTWRRELKMEAKSWGFSKIKNWTHIGLRSKGCNQDVTPSGCKSEVVRFCDSTIKHPKRINREIQPILLGTILTSAIRLTIHPISQNKRRSESIDETRDETTAAWSTWTRRNYSYTRITTSTLASTRSVCTSRGTSDWTATCTSWTRWSSTSWSECSVP